MKKLIVFVAIVLMSIGASAQDLKYETIWSMYSGEKLAKMPKYIVEEAESFSIIIWKDKTRSITILTSSPDGEDEIVMKVNGIVKEGNKTTYKGTGPNCKMIITINALTKWIVVTNMLRDGNSMYEYHKIQ